MGKLTGKTALITGGNSGIGLATAKLFVQEGAKVAITARRQDAVDEYNKTTCENTFAILADAANPAENEKMMAAVTKKFGNLDIVFLNAGVGIPSMLGETSEALYDQQWDLNCKGPFFTAQAALPHLNAGATIIFTCSVADILGTQSLSIYNATKAAQRSLVRTFANELAPKGIRVNAVSPGPIDTPTWTKTGMSEEEAAEMKKAMAGQVPMGRIGKPEEVASVALFLASEDSSFITGAEIPVDGGWTQV